MNDVVSLDVSELNFAKKVRGKKPIKINDVSHNLTRRHCVSKVAELYDISGKITPLTAPMKLDLHHFVDLGIGWDERIPDNLRQVWDSHFKMMEEISQIKYRRAIVPEDAINLEIDSIDTGDASKTLHVLQFTHVSREGVGSILANLFLHAQDSSQTELLNQEVNSLQQLSTHTLEKSLEEPLDHTSN